MCQVWPSTGQTPSAFLLDLEHEAHSKMLGTHSKVLPRAALAWLFASAVSCNCERNVPFKQPGAQETKTKTPPANEFQPTLGTSFPAKTRRITIENTTLSLKGEDVRAVLALENPKRTKAFVVASAQTSDLLRVAQPNHQDPKRFDSKPIHELARPEECTTESASIRTLSSRMALGTVRWSCDRSLVDHHWIADTKKAQLLEHVSSLPSHQDGRPRFSIQFRASDADHNNYEDLNASLKIEHADDPILLELSWLNRPAGLVRDRGEPEQFIRHLADEAWRILGKKPGKDLAKAKAAAERALYVHRVLCAESGAARLRIGGAYIPCRESTATARARAALAAVMIREGKLHAALELSELMEDPTARASQEERTRVDAEWGRVKQPATAAIRPLVRAEVGPDANLRYQNLFFLNDDVIVLRTHVAQQVDIRADSPRLERLPRPVSAPLTDAKQTMQIERVYRDCGSYSAMLSTSPTRVRGGLQNILVPLSASTNTVPWPPTKPSAIKPPTRLPACPAANTTRFAVAAPTIVAWAPQGFLVTDQERLNIVSAEASGVADSERVALESSAPVPLPLRGSRMTPDGSRYVVEGHVGILVTQRGSNNKVRFLRPSGWENIPGLVRAAAIAPHAQRVAILKGHTLALITW